MKLFATDIPKNFCHHKSNMDLRGKLPKNSLEKVLLKLRKVVRWANCTLNAQSRKIEK